MNYIVDTNLACEPTKPRPDTQVLAWLSAHRREFYVSSISIAEIRRGVERLPTGRKREALEIWFTAFCRQMKKRVISFNTSTAHTWGQLAAKWERNGITLPLADSYIAATAQQHKLTVVTRNVSDFQRTGVRLINPFGDSA